MKRVHSFSGGIGSMTAAKRDSAEYGTEDMILLFTDTLIEDQDLYRFLIESAAFILERPKPLDVLEKCTHIPEINESLGARRAYLAQLSQEVMDRIPQLYWLVEGRDPWGVFHDERWIGNSRVAQCSAELKQKMAREWMEERYGPEEAIIYVGIDWTEIHRMKAIQRGWAPYEVKAPMTEAPYWDKHEMLRALKKDGIRKPRLYDMGFAHNNCFHGDTKFITSDGIYKLRDKVGEQVKVLGSSSGWKDATIQSFGKQKLWKLTMQRYGDTKIILTTATHRWFIREKRTMRKEKLTYELLPGDPLFSMHAHFPQNIKASPFGIAHGITFGDGSGSYTTNSPTTLTLCGEKDRQLLKWFPNCDIKVVPNIGLKVCDLPRKWKFYPPMDESKSYLYGWLAGYFAADGTLSKGQVKICSAIKENIEFVRSVCAKLGISTNPIRTEYRKGYGEQKTALYTVALVAATLREDFFLIEEHRKKFNVIEKKRPAEWKVLFVEETDQEEEVFCAVVPDGHSFCLEDNILTGNCGGFCVRAGQGHFINLLQKNRDLYLYHEQKEFEMQEFLGRTDVSILTRDVKGEEHKLTLRELREEWDHGLGNQIDLFDIGGCGCFAYDI